MKYNHQTKQVNPSSVSLPDSALMLFRNATNNPYLLFHYYTTPELSCHSSNTESSPSSRLYYYASRWASACHCVCRNKSLHAPFEVHICSYNLSSSHLFICILWPGSCCKHTQAQSWSISVQFLISCECFLRTSKPPLKSTLFNTQLPPILSPREVVEGTWRGMFSLQHIRNIL